MMFFSRITLISERLDARQLAQILSQDSYQDHQCIWRLFPGRPDAQRDFLFRREQKNGWPCVYVIASHQPVDQDRIWHIETKPYAPKLYAGQHLAFTVRVNPVVTRWSETEQRQERHDVVMDAKKAMNYASLPQSERPSIAEIAHQAGITWFMARCEKWGFLVSENGVRVDRYSQHHLVKRDNNRTPIRFSTLDYTGVLRVNDPDLFTHTLYHGIGRAKGLGCGLLLVKPLGNE
jgi:CRISPR system Cascade subunit CasE